MFDAHIHFNYGKSDTPQEFLTKAAAGGVTGGNIICPAPKKFLYCPEGDYRWEARLEAVLEFTSQAPGFHPFFWFDPTAEDYEKQITTAAEAGIAGFKIICTSYYPEECIPACRCIAETGKPVMFHSGVLGESRDMLAAKYNMPSNFEALFAVKDLHFSLAHLGWPWVDDYMAMVAKSCFTYDPQFNNRMFFDLTPGTPGIYREESLRKLYLAGYKIKNLVLWGTDGDTRDYAPQLPIHWMKRDKMYMEKIAADAPVARFPFAKDDPDLSDIFHLAAEENWKNFLSGKPL